MGSCGLGDSLCSLFLQDGVWGTAPQHTHTCVHTCTCTPSPLEHPLSSPAFHRLELGILRLKSSSRPWNGLEDRAAGGERKAGGGRFMALHARDNKSCPPWPLASTLPRRWGCIQENPSVPWIYRTIHATFPAQRPYPILAVGLFPHLLFNVVLITTQVRRPCAHP